jgi:hypothetical protein
MQNIDNSVVLCACDNNLKFCYFSLFHCQYKGADSKFKGLLGLLFIFPVANFLTLAFYLDYHFLLQVCLSCMARYSFFFCVSSQ